MREPQVQLSVRMPVSLREAVREMARRCRMPTNTMVVRMLKLATIHEALLSDDGELLFDPVPRSPRSAGWPHTRRADE